MARSRPAQRKQAQPESKKALVIFLVFFILTTIGGGLFGYQGYTSTEGKEAAVKAADDCVQIHGGYGFVKDYPAEKYFRDVKLTTIGEGTSEIQRLVIARQLLAK